MDENDPVDEQPRDAEIIRVALCPLCRKPREFVYRPFCSKRCADLDLSRWFNGVYAAPAPEGDTEDEDF